MFTIAFGDKYASGEYRTEWIRDPYKPDVRFTAPIGKSFTDFISIEWKGHPYLLCDPDTAENITEDSRFLVEVRQYVELGIENPEFFSDECLAFFLDLLGMNLPSVGLRMVRKPGHEDDTPEEAAPEGMTPFERAMYGFLERGDSIYDEPVVEFTCETVEDACVASLYFLLSHNIRIRKCRNCGRYFIPQYRTDTIYCDRMSLLRPDRTCRQEGAMRSYQSRLSEDALKKQIRNTTTARRMRVTRNPENTAMAAELASWLDQLRKHRAQYKRGDLSEEEFMAWLDETKRYNGE